MFWKYHVTSAVCATFVIFFIIYLSFQGYVIDVFDDEVLIHFEDE